MTRVALRARRAHRRLARRAELLPHPARAILAAEDRARARGLHRRAARQRRSGTSRRGARTARDARPLHAGLGGRGVWRDGLGRDRPLGRLLERTGIDGDVALGPPRALLRRPHDRPGCRTSSTASSPSCSARPLAFREASYRLLARFADHLLVEARSASPTSSGSGPARAGRQACSGSWSRRPPRERQPELEELRVAYGFSGRYLYLPNQFWVHKNHALVIDALGCLREPGGRAWCWRPACQDDRRRPGHFDELMEHGARRGHGGLPRARAWCPTSTWPRCCANPVALINPSRFEGWSTTVEEAKSMGKRVLLSDIPVHASRTRPAARSSTRTTPRSWPS